MDETVEEYLRKCEDIDQGAYEVTKWEADFLESILDRDHTWLSDRHKYVIDEMSKKYLEGRD